MSIHSKVYVWCKGKNPVKAFAGSANYTNMGFKVSSRKEILVECDPVSAYQFFEKCKTQSISCHKVKQSDFVRSNYDTHNENESGSVIQVENDNSSPYYGLQKIVVPLRNANGNFGCGSGLNWGISKNGLPRLQNKKNPTGGMRDPNEAYIRFPKKFDCGFFPPYVTVPRGVAAQEAQIRFSVLTEDNHLFTCIRASGGYGKEIQTPQDNAELGRWFRQRLNLPSGAMITPEVMRANHKENVTFYKLKNDQFFMVF